MLQDEPVSNTTVDQAFDTLLPWHRFSLRLRQADIPNLPRILADFPDDRWRELRRNLACAWPRVLWLQPDNEAPGTQAYGASIRADATAKLGKQAFLSGYDAFESVMHTLAQKAAVRRGATPVPFDWHTPAASCTAGAQHAGTPPVSELLVGGGGSGTGGV